MGWSWDSGHGYPRLARPFPSCAPRSLTSRRRLVSSTRPTCLLIGVTCLADERLVKSTWSCAGAEWTCRVVVDFISSCRVPNDGEVRPEVRCRCAKSHPKVPTSVVFTSSDRSLLSIRHATLPALYAGDTMAAWLAVYSSARCRAEASPGKATPNDPRTGNKQPPAIDVFVLSTWSMCTGTLLLSFYTI